MLSRDVQFRTFYDPVHQHGVGRERLVLRHMRTDRQTDTSLDRIPSHFEIAQHQSVRCILIIRDCIRSLNSYESIPLPPPPLHHPLSLDHRHYYHYFRTYECIHRLLYNCGYKMQMRSKWLTAVSLALWVGAVALQKKRTFTIDSYLDFFLFYCCWNRLYQFGSIQLMVLYFFFQLTSESSMGI